MIKEVFKKIEQSLEYKDIIDSGLYLANLFFIVDPTDNLLDGFNFGFYDEACDTITTIKLDVKDNIELSKDQEIAKQNSEPLKKIDLSALNHDYTDIKLIMSNFMKENHSNEKISKTMILLHDDLVYNNSIICESGNIIVVVISGLDGNIVKNSVFNVRDLIQKKTQD